MTKPGKSGSPTSAGTATQRPPQNNQNLQPAGQSSVAGGGSAVAEATGCEPMIYGDADESGKVDIDDTLCVLNGFADRFDDCPFEFVDIHPCPGGNGIIDGNDLEHMIWAFQGVAPAECLNACRPCVGNLLPTARAGADLTVQVNQAVDFSGAASSDPDGRIVSYEWDFGPGQRAYGETVTRSFTAAGVFTVRLFVMDGCGAVASDWLTVTVAQATCGANNVAPTARAGSDRSAVIGERLTFNASSSSDSDGILVNYWWSFGDGQSTGWQPLASVDHVYNQSGSFLVTLWVQDNCGLTSAADQALVTVSAAVTLRPELTGFAIGNIGTAQGVAVSNDGRKIYVASQEFGVVELDSTDPRNPTFSRTAHIFEPAEGVVAGSSFLVTGGATNEAKLINLDTFATPDETRVPLGFVAHGIAVSGDLLCVAAGPNGLKVVRLILNDSSGPSVASTATVPISLARGVAITPNRSHAYVAAGPGTAGGLKVVSLAAGTASLVTSLAPQGSSNSSDIALDEAGTTAYLADYGGGLTVVDVRTPSQPVRVTSIATSGPANKITRVGNLLLVATVGGAARMHVFNIQGNPRSPVEIGSIAGQYIDFDGRGESLYVATGTAGVSVMSLTDPTRPVTVTTLRSNFGSRTACASDGRIALVGGDTIATWVVDVTDPAMPRPVFQLATVAQDIRLHGSMAFVAAGASGFRIYDVSNPQQPTLRWTVAGGLYARGVDVSPDGDWAYVAAGTQGGSGRVAVYDVSNLAVSPVLVTNTATSIGGSASDIALSSDGRLAFVADYGGGLQALDLTNPAHPVRIGDGLNFAELATRVAVSDDLVLVATWSQQSAHLAVVDASNPEDLVEVGSLAGVFAGAIDTFQQYALLPSQSLGLVIADLSNPSVPRVVASVDTPGPVSSVARSGNMVYLGDTAAILDVVDLFGD